jgi:hypothetical protein
MWLLLAGHVNHEQLNRGLMQIIYQAHTQLCEVFDPQDAHSSNIHVSNPIEVRKSIWLWVHMLPSPNKTYFEVSKNTKKNYMYISLIYVR